MTEEPMKNRVVRVSDRVWDAAKARADNKGESISDAIRKFLERYGRMNGYVVIPMNPGTDPETTRAEADVAATTAGGTLTGDHQVYVPGQYKLLVDGQETIIDDLHITRWTMTNDPN